MLIILSNAKDIPVYEQIADAIKQQLFAGTLSYDDELPSVRTMAGLLNVNMHTVRHAYKLLAAEGIILMRLGRRTRICPRPEARGMTSETKRYLLEKWRDLEREAYLRGLAPGQFKEFVRQNLENGEPDHV